MLKALGARVPKSVTRVGLFVDPDDALLEERLVTGAIDLVQLHGTETPERVAAIKARTGKPVMKVINVDTASDVERGIAAYSTVADWLMFDAAVGTLPGGNAKVFEGAVQVIEPAVEATTRSLQVRGICENPESLVPVASPRYRCSSIRSKTASPSRAKPWCLRRRARACLC